MLENVMMKVNKLLLGRIDGECSESEYCEMLLDDIMDIALELDGIFPDVGSELARKRKMIAKIQLIRKLVNDISRKGRIGALSCPDFARFAELQALHADPSAEVRRLPNHPEKKSWH